MPAGAPLYRNQAAESSSALRKEEAKSLIKFLTSSLLTFCPFLRAQKSVQMYLVSRGNTASESTVSEFYGRARSWVSEGPSVLFRSTGLLE